MACHILALYFEVVAFYYVKKYRQGGLLVFIFSSIF